ncbi:hypothetical protein BJY24_005795 [Nocardia transvalensis]|uniref:MmyB-like transcription regulator ligand binding domain-containing protein n=1 Tax=Nocardia transvalensis TaxID=37333 RepID=A0A7W9PJZ0_9NOCA|nr:helix-turn-helix domain-containing protein [Nocardia transvalensis]MBB5916883.1 hypothetical protein [Nocardia transvalensis]
MKRTPQKGHRRTRRHPAGPDTGVLDLGRYLTQLRETTQPKLSRRLVEDITNFSQATIRQLEANRLKHPRLEMLDVFARLYRADSAQTQHIRDLASPPLPLAGPEPLRDCLLARPEHMQHLDDLERRGVLAGYFDPMLTVLAMNTLMRTAFVGLAEIGSLARWWFSPAGLAVVVDHPTETEFLVAFLKGQMGRYRTAPRTLETLAELLPHPQFHKPYTTSTRIAFERSTSDPIHFRNSDTGEIATASVHIQRVSNTTPTLLFSVFPHEHVAIPNPGRDVTPD